MLTMKNPCFIAACRFLKTKSCKFILNSMQYKTMNLAGFVTHIKWIKSQLLNTFRGASLFGKMVCIKLSHFLAT